MAWAQKLKGGWRAAWRTPDGRILYEPGFPTKKAAVEHGRDQEAEQRRRGERARPSATLTVEDWANDWYAGLDLDINTMRQYKGILENHIIPQWGDWILRDLADADTDVTTWVKELRAVGYSDSRIRAVRGRFHTLCADAVQRGLLYRNPAVQPRSRGKAAPRRARQVAERKKRDTVTNPLGALLIAERAAVLTGRDDEFTMMIAKYYTGLRWGELAGVEKTGVKLDKLRVDWQLSPVGKQGLARKPPKYGAVREVDLPRFLGRLLLDQADRVKHPEVEEGERWCPCGRDLDEEYRHPPGIHLFSGRPGEHHWGHSTFLYQYFTPAAVGLYYPGQAKERPVYVDAPEGGQAPHVMDFSPKPSTRSHKRAEHALACWAPVAPGMRDPHSLRHSHKTLMDEIGAADALKDERLGHLDSSVQARYSHVTDGMRTALVDALSTRWEESLTARAGMDPRSPVPVLDGLLAAHRKALKRRAPRRLRSA